jgi:hypothetical protein
MSKNCVYSRKLPKSIDEIKPIDRIPIVGYMGHKPVFRHPIRQCKVIRNLVILQSNHKKSNSNKSEPLTK